MALRPLKYGDTTISTF